MLGSGGSCYERKEPGSFSRVNVSRRGEEGRLVTSKQPGGFCAQQKHNLETMNGNRQKHQFGSTSPNMSSTSSNAGSSDSEGNAGRGNGQNDSVGLNSDIIARAWAASFDDPNEENNKPGTAVVEQDEEEEDEYVDVVTVDEADTYHSIPIQSSPAHAVEKTIVEGHSANAKNPAVGQPYDLQKSLHAVLELDLEWYAPRPYLYSTRALKQGVLKTIFGAVLNMGSRIFPEEKASRLGKLLNYSSTNILIQFLEFLTEAEKPKARRKRSARRLPKKDANLNKSQNKTAPHDLDPVALQRILNTYAPIGDAQGLVPQEAPTDVHEFQADMIDPMGNPFLTGNLEEGYILEEEVIALEDINGEIIEGIIEETVFERNEQGVYVAADGQVVNDIDVSIQDVFDSGCIINGIGEIVGENIIVDEEHYEEVVEVTDNHEEMKVETDIKKTVRDRYQDTVDFVAAHGQPKKATDKIHALIDRIVHRFHLLPTGKMKECHAERLYHHVFTAVWDGGAGELARKYANRLALYMKKTADEVMLNYREFVQAKLKEINESARQGLDDDKHSYVNQGKYDDPEHNLFFCQNLPHRILAGLALPCTKLRKPTTLCDSCSVEKEVRFLPPRQRQVGRKKMYEDRGIMNYKKFMENPVKKTSSRGQLTWEYFLKMKNQCELNNINSGSTIQPQQVQTKSNGGNVRRTLNTVSKSNNVSSRMPGPYKTTTRAVRVIKQGGMDNNTINHADNHGGNFF